MYICFFFFFCSVKQRTVGRKSAQGSEVHYICHVGINIDRLETPVVLLGVQRIEKKIGKQ